MSIEIYRKNKDKNVYSGGAMKKPYLTTLFMTGAIPPQMLIGGLGRN